MENGNSNENKELTPTSTPEPSGDDTTHLQTELQPESSTNDLQQKDQEEVPTGTQSSNDVPVEDQQEPPSKLQDINNDLQPNDQAEVPSESQSSQNGNNDIQTKDQEEDKVELPSETQASKSDLQTQDQEEVSRETQALNSEVHTEDQKVSGEITSSSDTDHKTEDQKEVTSESRGLDHRDEDHKQQSKEVGESVGDQPTENKELKPDTSEQRIRSLEEIINEERAVEPIFDGTEDPDLDDADSPSARSSDIDPEAQGYVWPDRAVALTNFVREKGVVAVSTVLRHISGKKDEDEQNDAESTEKNDSLTSSSKDEQDLDADIKAKDAGQKPVERSTWNPLNYILSGQDVDPQNSIEQREIVGSENYFQLPFLKGRIMLYTKLRCQDCRDTRVFLHQKRLRYVEINVDIYPSRKLELEKLAGSSSVPAVFFNELFMGGLKELKDMDESGQLKEKINDLITKEPPREAPVPPLSGEDDESCTGEVDDMAIVVRRMKEGILIKDRFCRMRRFSNCFLASEAIEFLAEDQYFGRNETIEYMRDLASNHFFRHILEENLFEDGNNFYRFLDDDPLVSSECHNIPRGIIDAKPKPITDIAARLRDLSLAMVEAYSSVDGKHVDYRSIHGSEEFARYLRVVEELQRVDMQEMSREEKLAFFINLYNMMAIHAILTWGYPVGPLERRRMFGDFKYIIGGYTYSLSAIENGILRCNQRPPYNLMRPFGVKDERAKIILPYPEPLIHFALVSGSRSGPALRCFSPGNIDKELVEAARNFLMNGGIIVDVEAKVVSVNKILQWYSADFGKTEIEVLKHAANYLETEMMEELLELIATAQLKVVYLPYDWGVNC